MKIRNTIVGLGVLAVVGHATAVSLGGSRGNAVLGAPLDLVFDVEPDAGQDLAAACVSATVMAGDTPISASKIRVVPLPQTAGRKPSVRLQVSQAIDEPVITVKLTAGCTGAVSRSYTFLADLPAQAKSGSSPIDVNRLGTAPNANVNSPRLDRNKAVQPDLGRTPASASRPARTSATAGTNAATPQDAADASAAPRRRASSVVVRKPETASRPRLIVEPLDLWIDSPVTLRVSPGLMTMPSAEATPQRAEAAAMWRALNTPMESLSDTLNQAEALTSEVAALRQKSERDAQAAAQSLSRAEKAEKERFSAVVVYVLAGLLVIAIVAAGLIWGRSRKAMSQLTKKLNLVLQAGVRSGASRTDPTSGPASVSPLSDFGPASVPAAERSNRAERSRSGGDSDFPPSAAAPLPQAAKPPAAAKPAPAPVAAKASAPAPAAASPSAIWATPAAAPAADGLSVGAQRAIPPEELFDIQQQAEFFVSVGEHQQAIDVLKHHIDGHEKASPLAYLELLRLYHTLSRAEEFARLRLEFMRQFNAFVPEFSKFNRPGRSLERYSDALADIEDQWTSASVVALLEKLLFREAGDPSGVPFDLSAYDDLLLLWSIASTTAPDQRGAPAPRTRTTPLAQAQSHTQSFERAAAEAIAAMPVFGIAPEAVMQAPAPAPAPPQNTGPQSLESEFGLLLPRDPAASVTAPAPIARNPSAKSHRGLDLDLSDPFELPSEALEPPPITTSDLPPVPVTEPPKPGEAIGFGMATDRVELRLELERIEDLKPKESNDPKDLSGT